MQNYRTSEGILLQMDARAAETYRALSHGLGRLTNVTGMQFCLTYKKVWPLCWYGQRSQVKFA